MTPLNTSFPTDELTYFVALFAKQAHFNLKDCLHALVDMAGYAVSLLPDGPTVIGSILPDPTTLGIVSQIQAVIQAVAGAAAGLTPWALVIPAVLPVAIALGQQLLPRIQARLALLLHKSA